MFALFPIVLRGLTGLVFSSAAVIGAKAFLNKSKNVTPLPTKNQLSAFEIGKLILYGVGIYAGVKMVRDLMK